MRIRFASTDACAKRAKSIKRSLSSEGVEVSLSRVQEAVSRMLGYRSWQEFSVCSKVAGTFSEVDEDCDASERAQRLSFQTMVLAREFGITSPVAARIVEAVGLTARSTAPKDPAIAADADWRARLSAARRDDGFVTQAAAAWAAPSGPPDLAVDHEGVTLRAWVVRQDLHEGTDGIVAFRFAAGAYDGRALVGVLEGIGTGYCLLGGSVEGTLTQRISLMLGPDEGDGALVPLADAMVDAFGPELGGRAHGGLARKGAVMGSVYSPTPTDGLLMPAIWETAKGRVPVDCGLALWKAVFSVMVAKGWGHGTVLVDPEPPQYAGVVNRQGLPGYGKARAKIFDHLTWLIEDPKVERIPEFVSYEMPPSVNHGPRTVTAGTEPRALEEGDWPSTYDLDWLFSEGAPVKVAPHPTFWRHMPTELMSLTVVFDETMLAGGRDWVSLPRSWEFHFANGSTLVLNDDDLAEFSQGGKVPTELNGMDGDPLAVNPFASSMSTEDMIEVLAVNCSLVFAGGPDQPGRDRDRVTVCRAGR